MSHRPRQLLTPDSSDAVAFRTVGQRRRSRIWVTDGPGPAVVPDLHAKRPAILAKLAVAQTLDARRTQWTPVAVHWIIGERINERDGMIGQIPADLITLVSHC